MLDLDLAAFPPYTMLTAGFPCQPFSNRGHQRGLDDEKSGQMYLELVRILTETQPPCFQFENVTQLLLLDGGSRSARREGAPGTCVAGGLWRASVCLLRPAGITLIRPSSIHDTL